MIMRWSNPITAAQLNVRGYRAPTGPVLDVAPWDVVLVVEARSPDGVKLQMRIEPNDGPLERVEFGFRQLTPGITYTVVVSGEHGVSGEMIADRNGNGRFQASLLGPTSWSVSPVSPVSAV